MLRIVFAAAIIINLANLAATSINIICNSNISDTEFYTMPQTNCAQFYQCHSGQKINYVCPLGKMFDFFKQKCVSNTNICYESTCQGKYDGSFYADTTQSCRRFFHCHNEKVMSYENCKRGFMFNGIACERADRVQCNVPNSMLYEYHNYRNSEGAMISKRSCNGNLMDECQYSPDGLYPDEGSKDCKSYIKCLNGKKSHLRCPSSSVFHPLENSCVPDTIYECPKSTRLERLCKGKSDGLHSDPRFNCNSFVKCHRGVPVQFDECPNNLVFDSHRRSCVHKSNSYCVHESRSADCLHSEMGFYQDRSLESSCKNYYFCYNGRKTSYTCQTNELFNGESCVDERYYTCPNLDADSCDTKEDGYYKDNNLDCRSYFYCSSNRKYSFVCKDGQAFDGNRCVSKRHVEQCIKNSECLGKFDGYYQDLKSGCTKYFYCKQGDKLQVLTCRNGRVFNGNSCVSPQSYACPSIGYNLALKLNCVPRNCNSVCQRDGFFADYDSRCKSYYFCVGGSQTRLSCPKNFIFNENEGLCVPQNKYQCPVHCSNECSQ